MTLQCSMQMQLDCNILDHEVQILPKVELHAHLSGCFRASVLLRLLNIMNNQSALDQNLFNQYSDILNQVEQNHPNQQLNLIKCFDYFSIVNFIIQVEISHLWHKKCYFFTFSSQNQDALLKTDLASLYNVHNEANMNIFKHQTLSTKSPILYFLIKSVLLDFENDRVIYLELRFVSLVRLFMLDFASWFCRVPKVFLLLGCLNVITSLSFWKR